VAENVGWPERSLISGTPRKNVRSNMASSIPKLAVVPIAASPVPCPALIYVSRHSDFGPEVTDAVISGDEVVGWQLCIPPSQAILFRVRASTGQTEEKPLRQAV